MRMGTGPAKESMARTFVVNQRSQQYWVPVPVTSTVPTGCPPVGAPHVGCVGFPMTNFELLHALPQLTCVQRPLAATEPFIVPQFASEKSETVTGHAPPVGLPQPHGEQVRLSWKAVAGSLVFGAVMRTTGNAGGHATGAPCDGRVMQRPVDGTLAQTCPAGHPAPRRPFAHARAARYFEAGGVGVPVLATHDDTPGAAALQYCAVTLPATEGIEPQFDVAWNVLRPWLQPANALSLRVTDVTLEHEICPVQVHAGHVATASSVPQTSSPTGSSGGHDAPLGRIVAKPVQPG